MTAAEVAEQVTHPAYRPVISEHPPSLELIEELSGATWASQALGLKHIGFWARDRPAAAARRRPPA